MKLSETLYKLLPYQATEDQRKLIYTLDRFTESRKENPILILNGHAGTGKTSLIAAYVKSLAELKINSRLMAPTGRAAKVFASFAGKTASTVHRSIYWHGGGEGGTYEWKRQENKSRRTIFIVDEASMISSKAPVSGSGFTVRTLLEDLVDYVFSNEGNKLIMLGDLAQLPPIGEIESAALNPEYYKQLGTYPVALVSLKEVVRQDADSSILINATTVRDLIDLEQAGFPLLEMSNAEELSVISGVELEDFLESSYGQKGIENMIFITWSNKRANIFNQQIRARILWHEEEINAGDHIMVVKNNYYWLENDFIANGDVLVVDRVSKIEEIYDFKFADLSVYFSDDEKQSCFDVKVLLDVIMEEGPSLSAAKSERLFEKIEEDYLDIRSHAKRIKKIYSDPYFNALQIKFAYAVTAHKSQGGQWPIVFLEQPYIREALPGIEDLRWLYTGITRASSRLFLVNFSQQFFESH